ncbi:unnamed protein product [Ectocarpus fasciculatus]
MEGGGTGAEEGGTGTNRTRYWFLGAHGVRAFSGLFLDIAFLGTAGRPSRPHRLKRREVISIERRAAENGFKPSLANRKERLAIGDRSNASCSRGRVAVGLTAEACKT